MMQRRVKIWVKLSLFLTFVLMVSLGILALITWVFMNDLLTRELQESIVALNSVRQQQVKSFLDNQLDTVRLISSRATIRIYAQRSDTRTLTDREVINGVLDLQSATASLRGFEACTVYNDTTLLFDTNNTLYIPFFSTTSEYGVTGTYYNWTQIYLRITQAITGSNARIDCISNAQQLMSIIEDESVGPTGQVAIGYPSITPGSFVLLAPPRLHNQIPANVDFANDLFPAMRQAINGIAGLLVGEFFGQKLVQAYNPVDFQQWGLVTSIAESEAYAALNTLRTIILSVLGGMFGFSILVAYVFARLFTRPIHMLRTVAGKLSSGDLDARIVKKQGCRPNSRIRKCFPAFTDEMVELGGAFNIMAEQIKQQYSTLELKVQERTAQLEEAKTHADAANLAKSYFLANMSHEIRTPLSGIVGLTDICLESAESDHQHHMLNMLKTSADHLLHLVNDILDYSKIEADKLELALAPFDLIEQLDHLKNMFVILANKKDLQLIRSIGDDVPRRLIGDSSRLMQVLINLVGNGIKFTPQGFIELNIVVVKPTPNNTSGFFGNNNNNNNAINTSSNLSDLASPSPNVVPTIPTTSPPTPLTDTTQPPPVQSPRLSPVHPPTVLTTSFTTYTTTPADFLPVTPSSSYNFPTRRSSTTTTPMQTTPARESTPPKLSPTRTSPITQLTSSITSPDPLGVVLPDSGDVVLQFSVKDTGIGISQDNQKKLFEAFNQVDNSYSRRFGGTGLGLAISRKLVELMHGRIWVNSVEGQGTTFYFTAAFQRSKLPPKPEERLDQKLIDKPLRVLVAEDNTLNQQVITRILRKLKHEVKVVSNGIEVVQEIMNNPAYDVILMDIQMPELDGISATREIRKINALKDLPIVALTAHVAVSDMELCKEVGMDSFLTKPVDIKKLQIILAEVTKKSRSHTHESPRDYGETDSLIP